MKEQQNIFAKLSDKYGIPRQVIEVICNSPFKFTNEAISNLDSRVIRLTYLGKIKLKKRYEQSI